MKKIIKKCGGIVSGKLRSTCQFFRPNPEEYSTTDNITIIPVQREAYFLALNTYVKPGDEVLDVGIGLGYGSTILSIKAGSVTGLDVDPQSIEYCRGALLGRNPKLQSVDLYDGKKIPFGDRSFDLVTCIDVIEHVRDYEAFLSELLRVGRRGVFISTPNRRKENTNHDGTPKNYWHLREWSHKELKEILEKYGDVEWNFINGPWDGPFTLSLTVQQDTQALTPFLAVK